MEFNNRFSPPDTNSDRAKVVAEYWRQKNSGVEAPSIYALNLGLGPVTDAYARQWIENNTVNPLFRLPAGNAPTFGGETTQQVSLVTPLKDVGQTRHAIKTPGLYMPEIQFTLISEEGSIEVTLPATTYRETILPYFHDKSTYQLKLKKGEIDSIIKMMQTVPLDAGQEAFNQAGRMQIINCGLNASVAADLDECRRKALADCKVYSTVEDFLDRLEHYATARFTMVTRKAEKRDQHGNPWPDDFDKWIELYYDILKPTPIPLPEPMGTQPPPEKTVGLEVTPTPTPRPTPTPTASSVATPTGAPGPVPGPTRPPPTLLYPEKGDINRDGIIDEKDWWLLWNYYHRSGDMLFGPMDLSLADVRENGQLDPYDLEDIRNLSQYGRIDRGSLKPPYNLDGSKSDYLGWYGLRYGDVGKVWRIIFGAIRIVAGVVKVVMSAAVIAGTSGVGVAVAWFVIADAGADIVGGVGQLANGITGTRTFYEGNALMNKR